MAAALEFQLTSEGGARPYMASGMLIAMIVLHHPASHILKFNVDGGGWWWMIFAIKSDANIVSLDLHIDLFFTIFSRIKKQLLTIRLHRVPPS